MSTSHTPEPQLVGLELQGLQKRYGDVYAVKNVTLSVKPGEFLTLLGPSGSGKTTTLNMVAGFEIPSAGRIMLGDRDITSAPSHKRGLGMVFQSYALFPHMSVIENVMYPLKRQGGSKSEKRERAQKALDAVSLGHLGERKPSQLSGGQQQRVALARAFVSNPPIMLMDEPLSALDKALRTQMQEEIRRLHQELGTTMLFVTHDQEEAIALSDRIIIMKDGEIAQIGSPVEMYERPNSKFTASFLGAANFLEATVEKIDAKEVATLKLSDGTPVTAHATSPLSMAQVASLVLRPEDCLLSKAGAERVNTFTATFEEIVFMGDRLRCTGTFSDGSPCLVWVSHADADQVQVGKPQELYWDADRCVVVSDHV